MHKVFEVWPIEAAPLQWSSKPPGPLGPLEGKPWSRPIHMLSLSTDICLNELELCVRAKFALELGLLIFR